MSSIINVQQFLVDKTFHIPSYQRDYAWTTRQVDDLLSDVQEALETGSGHYLGTLVLAKNAGQSFEVVDGQQRLSTLALIIHALLQQLDPTDHVRIADEVILLRKDDKNLKLDFGNNASFVDNLFNGSKPTPTSVGQRKLLAAHEFASDRAKALASQNTGLVKQWLTTIKALEIIQFVAADTGRAIRMFQTVNDRGMPLTTMDKAKALLVYYSNRYLNGALDLQINAAFGKCFSAFDSLREFVSKRGYRIDNIARDTFTEDDLIRYHYLAYSNSLAVNASDYDGTVRTVFDGFLKGTLKKLCQNQNDLNMFISDYICDLGKFADAFENVISATATDVRLYKLFVIMGLAAKLYPLTIRLHQRGMLWSLVPGAQVDLLHCIEVSDVRVYKTRGTDPAKDIGNLSHKSQTASVQDLADGLRNFTTSFMPDGTFQTSLSQDMYHNGALLLFLVRKDEDVLGSAYVHANLLDFVNDQITREHIIAQTPNWSINAQGFIDETDFKNHLHMFGNLTLLTKSENSSFGNSPTHTKMTDPNMYASSKYTETKSLAHTYILNGSVFTKGEILKRTQDLASFVMKEWAIW